jgi:hypothetical protein
MKTSQLETCHMPDFSPFVKSLTTQQALVCCLTYGLNSRGMTLSTREIASRLRVSPSRVASVRKYVNQRLFLFIEEHVPGFSEVKQHGPL